jgi:hypothetical protein
VKPACRQGLDQLRPVGARPALDLDIFKSKSEALRAAGISTSAAIAFSAAAGPSVSAGPGWCELPGPIPPPGLFLSKGALAAPAAAFL